MSVATSSTSVSSLIHAGVATSSTNASSKQVCPRILLSCPRILSSRPRILLSRLRSSFARASKHCQSSSTPSRLSHPSNMPICDREEDAWTYHCRGGDPSVVDCCVILFSLFQAKAKFWHSFHRRCFCDTNFPHSNRLPSSHNTHPKFILIVKKMKKRVLVVQKVYSNT